ncbi:filamentation induced by cAMP protein Fic [Desulfofarcimen acetoxidans DSM 771]|uniref:Filamentation induced by cAMP protein Fic n=1 Tax=Desulfofarcimen acetoxidans (strain ATCC 49208 / DSM 771 / KCTC 5769 / VKM B-1644 / 5575) TaxID=485916 RepID=C8W5J5_DESAS|nr:Fic family protein [Desulfofarcimen acetoxidans]ACV63995.1 filamentation induced by cAMP protein Fic [Desulfofarcimen acetoxidans DSM 771]
MEESIVTVWRPINFNEKWLKCSISKLLNILPSWEGKREQLKKDTQEYQKFLNRLKRQHAIETGIIERLYDLKEGITETFIKEGFKEIYLQHGDTNIPQRKLMDYLHDNFEAIDFVFDVVKNNRMITKSFILELHQLITTHQDYIEAIDTLGNIISVKLLKGVFKKHDNNPRRSDGSVYLYCPPIQVESEIDKLLSIYNEMENKNNTHPVILAAWFHHSFVQIHPFQDGNGRMARLLASLILIKHNLFPLIVNRKEKKIYIESLELADTGEYQPLVDLFCDIQIRNIQFSLNWKTSYENSSYNEIVKHFSQKILDWKLQSRENRQSLIDKNRNNIFVYTENVLNSISLDLQRQVNKLINISLQKSYPGDYKDYYFTHQIIEYAKQHDYYFNRSFPRGWFKILFILSESRSYQLVITIHHYGYDDSTIAIGAILEFIESKPSKKGNKGSVRKSSNNKIITALPLEIKPLTISAEIEIADLEANIKLFLEDTITITLARVANEVY